jgi:hypothetical protein
MIPLTIRMMLIIFALIRHKISSRVLKTGHDFPGSTVTKPSMEHKYEENQSSLQVVERKKALWRPTRGWIDSCASEYDDAGAKGSPSGTFGGRVARLCLR